MKFFSKLFDRKNEDHEFVQRLVRDGTPIEVTSLRPKSILGNWLVDEYDERLFQRFESFGARFAAIYDESPYRLRERLSADYMPDYQDSPYYGPAYDFMLANHEIGRVHVFRTPGATGEFESSVHMELEYSLYLGYETTFGLLGTIHSLAANVSRETQHLNIQESMMRCMWNKFENPETTPVIILDVDGSYEPFFKTTIGANT